jgi:catechol 2,3-dioxygenase-like lactoylglutathione lyase family enzyme
MKDKLMAIHPKLPMRDKTATRNYYSTLGFHEVGDADFDAYLMMEKDQMQIHFFEFRELDPAENYGQIYIRTEDIDTLYQAMQDEKIEIHPNGHLQTKPWQQREFSLLDPDNNLLTFGQGV